MEDLGIAISARDLSKRFKVSRERRMGLKERVVRGRAPKAKEFWALREATFDVPKGSMFGIVGHNGSGKSTALKVIAGIYRPTSGSVTVNGKLSALLELGAGFHPELTGRENIALNASILGMTTKEIEAQTEEIIDFSGIGDFIDAPVKNYSSGMYVRLGFAVAVKVNPEILVIDEVIAVGDEDFQRKCFDYISDLRHRGSTVVIVSHALGVVADACDQAMWLDHGVIQSVGDAREVVDAYVAQVNRKEAEKAEIMRPVERGDGLVRRGTGQIRVTGIQPINGQGVPVPFLVTGEPGGVRMSYVADVDEDDVVFGLNFFTPGKVNLAGTSCAEQGEVRVPAGKGHMDFITERLVLSPDKYLVSTAVATQSAYIDLLDKQFELIVRSNGRLPNGLVDLPGDWRLTVATQNA